MARTPRLTYPMRSMPSLICVGVAWRVFYHSRAFNLPFNGGRSGCFIETSRGRFSVFGFIASPSQPRWSSPSLPPLLIINRINRREHWVSWMWCCGVKRPFTTRKRRFLTVLLCDINVSLVIWVIYSGGDTTQCYIGGLSVVGHLFNVDWARNDQRNE